MGIGLTMFAVLVLIMLVLTAIFGLHTFIRGIKTTDPLLCGGGIILFFFGVSAFLASLNI